MSAFENMFPIFKDRAGGSVKIEALMGSTFLGGESMRVDPTHYKISFLVIFRLLTSIDRHHGDNDNTKKKNYAAAVTNRSYLRPRSETHYEVRFNN